MNRNAMYLAVAMVLGIVWYAAPARADIVVQTSGSTDPTTKGFTNDFGGTPAPGSAGVGTWNISGSWCCTYAIYLLDGSQVSDLNAATSWTLTATFSNLSTDTGATEAGSYAGVDVNGARFDLSLHSDGNGNQILSLDDLTGAPDYTILGLGTNPVTLSLIYNNTTDTADAYVNGADVISGWAGYTEGFAGVFFGGEDGDFSNVELETGSVLPTPEPGSVFLFLGVVGLLGRRLATKP